MEKPVPPGDRYNHPVQRALELVRCPVLSATLFGPDGLALTAVAAAAMIPTANVFSVLALSHFGDNSDAPRRNPFLELTQNPLVLACVIGGLVNLSGIQIPSLADTVLETLASAALALGLLSAGAAST